MSDAIKHECGIALVRLLKPLSYYQEKYGSMYALDKMYLLMEKQHNRGQDGAGMANVKFDVPPGQRYISRIRSNKPQPIKDLFSKINDRFSSAQDQSPQEFKDPYWRKENLPYTGEVFMGHLRYGTFGGNNIEQCHPFLRQNNWMNRNLILAGNFNMTNVDQLFQDLVDLGQHPKQKADTVTILEKIGHFLDVENEELFQELKGYGKSKLELAEVISEKLDIQRILQRSSKKWDGGYAMVGLIGNGDAFVMRDPAGIRPAYWYKDDEVVVVASERPVIQTVFNTKFEDIQEVTPGHALIMKKNGDISEKRVREEAERKACSFERIYFSRGSDKEIYQERLNLGRRIVPRVLESINNEVDKTVFSFIPNTAEVAFYGMIKGMDENHQAVISKMLDDGCTADEIKAQLDRKPRVEKIAIKDAKLRTFITEDAARDDMVAHVYDISYGTVKPGDNLVVLDDSIVRGTTLKQSIIGILDRLGPKKIIVVSSAPQIRYPDCYGIDMAKLGDFIAFRAMVELLKENGKEHLMQEAYQAALKQVDLPDEEVINHVKELYDQFTADEISDKIAELVKPDHVDTEVDIIFQTIEDLHLACPKNLGDWYFTGNYPTPGGNRVVNRAFIYFMEGRNERAY